MEFILHKLVFSITDPLETKSMVSRKRKDRKEKGRNWKGRGKEKHIWPLKLQNSGDTPSIVILKKYVYI